MVKVQIIDVNLGEDIDDIISDDVETLTKKNEQDIEDALNEKKSGDRTRGKKQFKKDPAETKALETLWEELIKAHEDSNAMSIDEMLEITKPVIKSPTSLLMQLRNHIKREDLHFTLKKFTKQRKTHYELVPY